MTSVPATTDTTTCKFPAGACVRRAGDHRVSPRVGRCIVLSLRQHLHGKRWMALAVLFLLPAGMAILIRKTFGAGSRLFLDFVLHWILVPQAILAAHRPALCVWHYSGRARRSDHHVLVDSAAA